MDEHNSIINKNIEPVLFFGYDHDLSNTTSPTELPEKGLLCMVSDVVPKNITALNHETGMTFKLGDWFVSSYDDQDKNVTFGPFENEHLALNFCRENYPVVKFRGSAIITLQ